MNEDFTLTNIVMTIIIIITLIGINYLFRYGFTKGIHFIQTQILTVKYKIHTQKKHRFEKNKKTGV